MSPAQAAYYEYARQDINKALVPYLPDCKCRPVAPLFFVASAAVQQICVRCVRYF